MVQVVDNKTNEVQDLSATDATQALLSGSHSLQQTDSGKIALVNPNGQVFSGPTAGAYQLLAKGWRLEGVADKAKVDVAHEQAEAPIQSAIEQGGESFLNQLAGGIPSILNDATDNEYQKAHQQAEEEAHGTARTVGGVAGFLGSLATGAEAFKGAGLAGKAAETAVADEGAGLGTRLLGKAVGGLTEGALVSAPQAVTEAAVGDKQKAAESLALGAGIGSILGLGGGAFDELKSALSETSKTAQPTPLLDALQDKAGQSANKDALRLAGFQKSQLQKIPEDERQALGQFLFDKGLLKPGMSKEDIANAINDMHKQVGQSVKDHLAKFDDVLAAKPELQELAYNPMRAADRLRTELGGAALDMPMYASEKNELAKIADSVEQMGKQGTANGAVDFRTAQDTKNLFQKFQSTWSKLTTTPKEELQQQAYGIVNDEMEQAADRVSTASGDDSLAQGWRQSKDDFRKLSQLKKGADNLLAGDGGNRKFGLTDFITGSGAGAAGAALGHAILGPLGIAAAPLSFLGSIFLKHLAENQGNILATSAMKKFADADLSKIGVLSALAGSNGIDSQASKIGDAIKGQIVSGVQRLDPISAMLGPSANGLSKQQQFDKLATHINGTVSDPNQLANNVSTITSVVHHTGAPQTAQALTNQYTKTASYLQAAIPKPPPPNPFVKQAWKPSPQDMQAFKDKLAVVQNPFIVLDELAKNTLNANHLDALQKVYPAIYNQIQQAALNAANHSNTSVPYATRLRLSLLMGKPLDDSLANVAAFQANYGPTPNPNAGRGHDITAPDLSTTTQKISAGQSTRS